MIAVLPSKSNSAESNSIAQLLDLLSKTLADTESLNVRVWSVRSLGKLAEFIEQGEDAEIVRHGAGLPAWMFLADRRLALGCFPILGAQYG